MSRVQTNIQAVLTNKAATGVSIPVDVSDSQNIGVQLSMFDTPTNSVKFQISFSDTAPDFGAAVTVTNHWTYVSYVDSPVGSVTAGSTAISSTGTEVHKNIIINVQMAKWFSVEVSAYTAGKVNAGVIKSDNQ